MSTVPEVVERPLIIAVVGGSGSGKTTVTRAIYEMEGVDAAFIDQDAYYRDLAHLTLQERKRVNFDHPDAFDTGLLVAEEFEIFGQRVAGATGTEIGGDIRLSDMGPDGNTG